MATLKQTTAFGPGVYRGHPFTLERLRSFVDGTNKAIAAGIPIPLLKKHAPINASDKATEQFATDDGQGVGWLTRVDLAEDGGLIWEAKNVPDATAAEVQQGTLAFTSPEFRNHYTSEKAGVYEGPIIRHIAFTPKPGNPHQGPITTESGGQISSLALEEIKDVAWQFAEFEKEPLPDDVEQFKEPIHLGNDWYFHKTAMDANGNHRVHLSKGANRGFSIQTNGVLPKTHNIRKGMELTDEAKAEILAHLEKTRGSQHEEEESQFSEGITSEPIWEKAKKAVDKKKYPGKHYWAVVSSVYQKMGGGYTHKSQQHSESEQFSESRKSLLRKYGYEHSHNYEGPESGRGESQSWFHRASGGTVNLHSGGNWHHYTKGMKETTGDNLEELKSHLSKIHGSQHSEDFDVESAASEVMKSLESIPPKNGSDTTASQYSEYSWVLPYPDFMAYLKEEATEQYAHREPVDEPLSKELELVNQHNVRHLNDHDYHRANEEGKGEHHLHQQRSSILTNLSKKHAKGVYDHEKAKKLWGYYAKALSDHYGKHYGVKANPATRAHLASNLSDYHREHNFEQYKELEVEQFSELKNIANQAFKLGKKRNLSTKARELHEEAYKATYRAVGEGTKHSHSMALNAHHDAARLIRHEGDADVADLHEKAAKHHRLAGNVSQYDEKGGETCYYEFIPQMKSSSELAELISKHGGRANSRGFTIPESSAEAFDDEAKKQGLGSYYKNETSDSSGVETVPTAKPGQYAENPPKNTDKSDEANEERTGEEVVVDPPASVNPDMPPVATDRNKLAAVIAGLAQNNIVLPSDFDFADEAALSILLAAINSSLKAKQEAEAEAEPADPDDEPAKDVAMPYQEIGNGYSFCGFNDGKVFVSNGDSIKKILTAGVLPKFNRDKVLNDGTKHELLSFLSTAQFSEYPDASEKEIEQFSERVNILKAHGYERDNVNSYPEKGYTSYKRKGVDRAGSKTLHDVTLYKNKKWTGSGGVSGTGHESLSKYLTKLHSSQHTEPQTQSSSKDYIMQFTEEELAGMPASVKAKLDAEVAAQKAKREEAEKKALQFEEEKKQQLNTTAKTTAVTNISRTPLPPAMKKELLAGFNPQNGKEPVIQFSEGKEQPTFTAEQVAQMFVKHVPKFLQFEDSEVVASPPPKGKRQVGVDPTTGIPVYAEDTAGEQYFESQELGDIPFGHVSPERARELVNSSPVMAAQRRGRGFESTGDSVNRLNNRN